MWGGLREGMGGWVWEDSVEDECNWEEWEERCVYGGWMSV